MDLWLIATAVLCVISHQMWGMLFYGILPTGTMFLDLAYPTKKSRSNLKPEPKGYIASTIGGAVNTGIQIAAMRLLGIQGQLLSNVAVGLVLPLFSFCDFLPHSFFEQRPFGLQLLSGAFHFGSGAIKGAIIGLML